MSKTEPDYASLLYLCLLFSVLFLFSVCGPCCLFQPGGALSKHALYTILGYCFFFFSFICRFLSGVFFALNSVGALLSSHCLGSDFETRTKLTCFLIKGFSNVQFLTCAFYFFSYSRGPGAKCGLPSPSFRSAKHDQT